MRVSILSCFAWMSAVATALSLDAPPKAAVRSAEDDYFGVKISDPYRWLENIKDSPEAQEWLKAQANYSRKLIDSMPGYEKLKARITELINSRPATIARPRQLANGNLFYLKTSANQNTASFVFEDRRPKTRLHWLIRTIFKSAPGCLTLSTFLNLPGMESMSHSASQPRARKVPKSG